MRMVERALPPSITDPDQERIAAEAAENGIRQTAQLATIVVVALLVVTAAMLYRDLPSRPVGQGPLDAAKAASQLDAENARLRQTNAELQARLATLTQEQDALQGKLGALQGQVAEMRTKLQAAMAAAASRTTHPRLPTGPAGSAARVRGHAGDGTYECGDGRMVVDPAQCRESGGVQRGTYVCGSGQTVRDPGECKRAAIVPPAGVWTTTALLLP